MTVTELVRGLRTLAQKPLHTPADLKEWQCAARELEADISAELADRVPHFVWHYLSDADIRLRDEVYRRDQEERLEAALREFEDG